jgi:hypothetical protein
MTAYSLEDHSGIKEDCFDPGKLVFSDVRCGQDSLGY